MVYQFLHLLRLYHLFLQILCICYTHDEEQLALTADNYTVVNGKLYHDAQKCAANASTYNTVATQVGAAALLGAAVTPLNIAEYEFIYPENLQAFGISANTNVGTTALQLEITYRPDFPLATDGGDQGQQMSDAGGTTGLLSMGVAQGIFGKGASAQGLAAQQYDVGNGNSAGTTNFAGVLATIKNFKRSNLPTISAATVLAGDYYSTPYFEYDVISGTLGTTSLFAASHPITLGLGADNAVFLTEFGFVSVDSLEDSRPVARGGYRDGVGGDKCGGVTKGGAYGATNFGGAANDATKGITHLASSQTHEKFGKLPFEELFKPTIDYANNGFPLTETIAYYLELSSQRFKTYPNFKNVWMPNGIYLKKGDVFKNPKLANTLSDIATSKRSSFYEGDMAKIMSDFVISQGGFLSTNDLAQYHAEWVEPVSTNYRGYDVWELPPNGQGIAALQILNLLERYNINKMGLFSSEYIHHFVEAKKLAFADRAKYYADPDFNDIDIHYLISKEYADLRAKHINPLKSSISDNAGSLKDGDTIYLTTADKEGNMVSLIQSNYRGMGSGMVPPGLGFMIQNRGELFSLDKDHANSLVSKYI